MGRYESSPLASATSLPERDSPKRWTQPEQWVADLQAEVASLRGHKERCERAVLSLLREMLQLRACVQLQDAELKRLRQDLRPVAQAPEKEALEFPSPQNQNQNQMQALDKRLVEVREALTQIRRKQALQDSERKDTEQEANVRLAELAGKLEREEQFREAACSALQRSQEDTSHRVDHEVAQMQAQVTKLGEEMSLRFLKREAKLCGFLQKSFLALEKRMKASESTRLKAESSLRGELDGRWQRLQELAEERVRALQGQHEQEESRLLEQCRGLDQAVIQLTKFVRQNQMSLNRILLAEQKAWWVSPAPSTLGQGLPSAPRRTLHAPLDAAPSGGLPGHSPSPAPRGSPGWFRSWPGPAEGQSVSAPTPRDSKGHLEETQAGELAAFLQESLEAGQLARQEAHSALELLREKSQALEVSLAELGKQVKDLSDHFMALSWRLDLQDRMLSLQLSKAKREWEGLEQRSQEGLAQCQKEAEAQLRELRERVDSLPRQIEVVSDKCVLHKSDSDLKISAEGRAREFEVGAVRQELATLLSSVQLLREGNPRRKIAEIQGKLATRMEETASLRESILRLRSEEGPWALTLGSRRVLVALGKQQSFVKDTAAGEVVPVNRWGVYQAVRWLQWKAVLLNLVAQRRPSAFLEKSFHQEPARQLMSLPLAQK